jgi:catechol 2,3-dioxygenase-like lactoylglutathione lyase family enzyme
MQIHTLTLHTNKLPEVLNFYQNTLGLARTGEAQFLAGASTLIFEDNPAINGIYHFAFNIPCNQIREAMHWLESRGIDLIADEKGNTLIDFSSWNAEATYFLDPAGNIVEFIARRDLHNASDTAFGPDAMLSVSEVGIVTRDVLAWNAQAARSYAVLPFEKSRPGPNFSALGTDAGLFIVVPEGRTWYMTDAPAVILPMAVAFENDAGKRFVYR